MNKYTTKQWWDADSSRLFRLHNVAREKYRLTKKVTDCEISMRADDDLRPHI